jgi:hypothetical protein
LDEDTIKASIFDEKQLASEEPYKETPYKKVGEKTFDIE